jgi:hypothetical protein
MWMLELKIFELEGCLIKPISVLSYGIKPGPLIQTLAPQRLDGYLPPFPPFLPFLKLSENPL